MMRRLASAALCAAFAFPVSAQVLLQQPRVEAELGDGAVLRALDKVNGQTKDTELVNGATVEMFGLLVTLEECRYPTDNPTGDAYAFLTIREPESGRLRFEGWMIASSPALSALDHNRYDVWVLRCRIS